MTTSTQAPARATPSLTAERHTDAARPARTFARRHRRTIAALAIAAAVVTAVATVDEAPADQPAPVAMVVGSTWS